MKKAALKRILSLVLCAVLCMACLGNAFADEITEGSTGELNDSLVIGIEPETVSKSAEAQSLVFNVDFSETVVINAISAAKVLVPEGWSVAVRGVGYTLENGDTEDHLLSVGYDSTIQMIAGAYSDEESYRHIHGLRLTYSVPADEAGSFALGLEDLWLGTINGEMVVNGVNVTKTVEIKGENGDDPAPVDPEPEVTDIMLDRESVTLKVGETATLTATVLPETAADVTVTWSSSDETAATVEGGVVTAAAKGEAEITASVGELSASCAVTVTAVESADPEQGTSGKLNESLAISTQPETLSKSDEGQSLIFNIEFSETVVINAISAAKVLAPEGWSVDVKGVGYTQESGDTEDHLLSIGYDSSVQMIAGAYSDEESYRHIHGLRMAYSIPAKEAGSFTLGLEDLWVGTIDGETVINGVNVTKAIEIKGENGDDPTPADPEPKVTDINLDRESMTLKVGETATLTATVLPETAANVTVTWSSSDGNVATVEDGVVSAASKGEATITASVGELSASCSVTVTAEGFDDPEPGNTEPEDSEELQFHKERALNTLEKQFGKYTRSDYEPEDWAQLVAAYEQGVEDILAAKEAQGAFIEDNVTAALNTALEAMQAVPAARTHSITVAVSMDANTLGLGFLVEPTLVTVDNHEQASVVITRLIEETMAEKYGVTNAGLSSKGLSEPRDKYPWIITGSVNRGFYLAQVYCPEQENVEIPDFILDNLRAGAILEEDRSGNYLGEFDYTNTSGWMYSISDGYETEFPGVGASGWQLSDGEVMRWQFTVFGYGSDLGADNTAWGQTSIVNVGDKAALTWAVAELRSEYDDETLRKHEAYLTALDVLTDPEARQYEVDEALSLLSDESFDEEPAKTDGSSTSPAPAGTGDQPKTMSFEDVAADAWYYDPVLWAVEEGITTGVSETSFAPGQTCTRAQIVTFLWRAAGSPAPESGNPFADVADGTWYHDAVLWAVEEGITTGKSATVFAPDDPCTRAQAVTFLWRAAGKPAVSGTLSFADVEQGAYYAAAVKWAADNGITVGIGDGLFGPELTCTRAQIVTFLYRGR